MLSTVGCVACRWMQMSCGSDARDAYEKDSVDPAELDQLRGEVQAQRAELDQLRNDARNREGEVERLRKSNHQLAQQHQALADIPARLVVPEVPAGQLLPTATEPGERLLRLQAELERRHKGGKRRAKRREPLTIESAYDVDGSGGRPAQVKAEMNEAVCEALRRCDPDLEAWVQADARHILLVIDSPTLGSATALLAAFPGLANSQQIVIPQYELRS